MVVRSSTILQYSLFTEIILSLCSYFFLVRIPAVAFPSPHQQNYHETKLNFDLTLATNYMGYPSVWFFFFLIVINFWINQQCCKLLAAKCWRNKETGFVAVFDRAKIIFRHLLSQSILSILSSHCAIFKCFAVVGVKEK